MARDIRKTHLDKLPTPPGKPMLYAPDSYKVRFLLDRNWSMERIGRHLGLTYFQVKQIKESYDLETMEGIKFDSESVRARHASILESIATKALDAFHRSPGEKKDPRFLRAAASALADVRDIYGLDAPTKSFSVQIKADASEIDSLPQAHIDDPESRRLLLAFEDRQRQLRAEREADVPGGVRRRGERRALAGQGSPAPDEPDRDGDRGREDQEAVDPAAAADREERILEQVPARLVSGELPGSAGDLG